LDGNGTYINGGRRKRAKRPQKRGKKPTVGGEKSSLFISNKFMTSGQEAHTKNKKKISIKKVQWGGGRRGGNNT